MDPLSTKSVYSNNIYSKEFLALLKKHLCPGGVLGIWTDNIEVMPRTVVTVFDRVKYYGQYFVASRSPIVFSEERYGQFMNSLLSEREVDLITDEKVIRWAEYKGDEEYIKENFQSAKINTDYKPIMEYYFLTRIGKLFKEIRIPKL
jgi:spermidine synthase